MDGNLSKVGTPHHAQHEPRMAEDATALPSVREPRCLQETPRGWPTSSRRIRTSAYVTVGSIAVDLTLLDFSIAFFVFGQIVNWYDQA
jgi:hypothetical protein